MGVAIFVGVLLVMIVWFFAKTYKENVAEEERQKLRLQQIREADAERQRKKAEVALLKAQLEQREEYFLKIGVLHKTDDIDSAVITCGNGHIHYFGDFQYAVGTTISSTTSSRSSYKTSTTSTTGYAHQTNSWGFTTSGPGVRYDSVQEVLVPQTDYDIDTHSEIEWEFGCPTCHTTVYEFKEKVYGEFDDCTIMLDGGQIRHCYLNIFSSCPCCSKEPPVVTCRHCSQKNRFPAEQLRSGMCGKCKTPFVP